MKKFATFIAEYITEGIYNFDEYLNFLSESFALPQVAPEKVSWATVKKGFDEVREPSERNRRRLARRGKKVKPMNLLGNQASNPKLAKGATVIPEFITKSLSLTPSDLSGRINTCSCATEECRAACLNTAGRGAMSSTQKGRLRKTNLMLDNPAGFMEALHGEVDTHERSAKKKGKRATVRLNVVSDIPYERLHPEIFTQHPDTQFYDYTKVARRVLNSDGTPAPLPKNYHLTLSSTGIHKESNWGDARQHLSNGGVVAMVFGIPSAPKGKPSLPLPQFVTDEETGKKFRIIDADIHDHRYLDKAYNDIPEGEGIIAGLRIKGGKKMLAKAGNFAVAATPGQEEVIVPRRNK